MNLQNETALQDRAPGIARVDPATITVPEPISELNPETSIEQTPPVAVSADPVAGLPSSFARNRESLEAAIFPGMQAAKKLEAVASADAILPEPEPNLPDPVRPNPLKAFSLLGHAEEFAQRAKDAQPLLGPICMGGQATMLYAPPNAGKTLVTLKLVLDAIAEHRIAAGNVYYVNADDTSSGIATKLRMLQDVGAHMLVPSWKGFKANDLIGLISRAADSDLARGTCIIIDTMKKFAKLMDKAHSSEFGNACRHFVTHGGTIVALAHTNKSPGADGKLKYAGTTDFLEDLDAAYLMTPMSAKSNAGERIVQLENIKRRGDNPELVAYAYAAETGISYEQRLASVRPVDPAQLEAFQPAAQGFDEAPVIAAIEARIASALPIGKMAMAKLIAGECEISERKALGVLEKFTGNDRALHRWRFRTGKSNVHMYEMLMAA